MSEHACSLVTLHHKLHPDVKAPDMLGKCSSCACSKSGGRCIDLEEIGAMQSMTLAVMAASETMRVTAIGECYQG